MTRIAAAFIGFVVFASAVYPTTAAAQSVTFQYVYDETGQLIKVIDSTGVVIEYVYDAVGNMLEVRRSNVDPAQLTIAGFSPAQGGPGTLVTIRGFRFSDQAGSNTLTFNGVSAAIVSATPNMIIAAVPIGATTGSIGLTVGTSTVNSSTPFTVLAIPIITAVAPRLIDASRSPSSITVSGANLSGSGFTVMPTFPSPIVTFGAPQANAAGTSAVVPVSVAASAKGTFVVVATNAAGSSNSVASAGNTVTIINASSDLDSDGDGFPDGLESLYGADPLDPTSTPDFSSHGDVIRAVSVVNTTSAQFPAMSQTLISSAVSVANTVAPVTSSQTIVGSALSVLNSVSLPATQQVTAPAVSVLNTLPGTQQPQQLTIALPSVGATAQANTQPLSASLSGLAEGHSLIEGQTVIVGANVEGSDGSAVVTFLVNGVPLVTDSSAPYTMTFTVPAGVSSLQFGATLADARRRTANARSIEISVERDVTTTVTGRVLDAAGNPVSGANIELLSEGLRAEFFDSRTPLVALPNLIGANPVRTSRVTALNAPGPSSIFGSDPFGVGLAPDYAARFTGWITVANSGDYTFYLGADEGARLRLDAATVVDMPTPSVGGYQEQSATITLPAGLIPVEVTFYESVGSARLQLSFVPPGGERQVVPPSMLVPSVLPYAVVTDGDGVFAIRGVPIALQSAEIRVSQTLNGQTMVATPARVMLSKDAVVQVADITLRIPR